MLCKVVSGVFVAVVASVVYHCLYEIPEEVFYEAEDWARSFGYSMESHKYISEDGFVTIMHRIPRGRSSASHPHKLPVLLQSGIYLASDSWLTKGPEQSLPFILADNGFDVWLNNYRGNHYSLEHVKGFLSLGEYYKHNSFHEIGYYDVPAAIDYILNATGHNQLNYIGFSMGCSVFMVMGSMRPQYLSKINNVVFMAPVLFRDINKYKQIYDSDRWQAFHKFIEDIGMLRRSYLRSALCSYFHTSERNFFGLPTFVTDVTFTFFGDSFKNDSKLKACFCSQHPSGPSAAQLEQLYDNFRTGEFTMRNYKDKRENMKRYGQETPPRYMTERINVPVHILVSEGDQLTGPQGVHFKEKLPNLASLYTLDEPIGHMEFVYISKPHHPAYEYVMNILTQN